MQTELFVVLAIVLVVAAVLTWITSPLGDPETGAGARGHNDAD